MTARVLVFAYIAFVLALSGFANASTAFVHRADVNQTTGILNAQGHVSTPCQTLPALVVNKIDETGLQVHMEVATTQVGQACPDVLGPQFDLALDLTELPLTSGKTYSLILLNAGQEVGQLLYTARNLAENEKAFRINRQNFRGVLVNLSTPSKRSRGNAFALHDGKNSVRLVSPQINLERFRNSEVWLSGYVIQMAELMDPLSETSPLPGPHAPVVIVPVSIIDLKK